MFLSGINCKIDIFVKLLDFPLLIHIEHKNGDKQSPFQLVPGIGKTETFYRFFFTFCLSRGTEDPGEHDGEGTQRWKSYKEAEALKNHMNMTLLR